MVITETRRVDTAWIMDGELTDRSVLSDELADFCAQYPIYHVREVHETLKVTGIQTEGEAIELTLLTSFNIIPQSRGEARMVAEIHTIFQIPLQAPAPPSLPPFISSPKCFYPVLCLDFFMMRV